LLGIDRGIDEAARRETIEAACVGRAKEDLCFLDELIVGESRHRGVGLILDAELGQATHAVMTASGPCPGRIRRHAHISSISTRELEAALFGGVAQLPAELGAPGEAGKDCLRCRVARTPSSRSSWTLSSDESFS
jgi:hypothetical protein